MDAPRLSVLRNILILDRADIGALNLVQRQDVADLLGLELYLGVLLLELLSQLRYAFLHVNHGLLENFLVHLKYLLVGSLCLLKEVRCSRQLAHHLLGLFRVFVDDLHLLGRAQLSNLLL